MCSDLLSLGGLGDDAIVDGGGDDDDDDDSDKGAVSGSASSSSSSAASATSLQSMHAGDTPTWINPAHAAGLKLGDSLVAINGVNVQGSSATVVAITADADGIINLEARRKVGEIFQVKHLKFEAINGRLNLQIQTDLSIVGFVPVNPPQPQSHTHVYP